MTKRTYIQAADGSLELRKVNGISVENQDDDFSESEAEDLGLQKEYKSMIPWKNKKARAFLPEYDPQRLVLTESVFKKMFAYCKAADGEISGFAKTRFLTPSEEKKFSNFRDLPAIELTEARIFNQTCSSGGTHLDMGDLSKFTVELIRAKEKPEEWNCWWHTHNDFGVFFSGIDTATIADLSRNSTLVSICINKMGDMTARLDKDGKLVRVLKPVILPDMNSDVSKACIEEVKTKVKEWKYVHAPRGNYQHGKSQKRRRFPDRRGSRGQFRSFSDWENGRSFH